MTAVHRGDDERVAQLRALGARRFTALPHAHQPVGDFDLLDMRLDEVGETVAQAGTPVVADAPEGLGVSGRMLAGPVADALCDVTFDDSDMLVCGSRGHGRSAASCSGASPPAPYATSRCR